MRVQANAQSSPCPLRVRVGTQCAAVVRPCCRGVGKETASFGSYQIRWGVLTPSRIWNSLSYRPSITPMINALSAIIITV